MKKRMLAMAMVVCMAVGVTGCQKTAPKAETAENKELETFDVVLDWYPNAVHGFIYEAIEKGYYVEEGLDVKIHFPANVNDGISMPAVGKADLGVFYMGDTIRTKANEDVPVKSVGAVLQSEMAIVLSLADKNIKTPKDLEGKKVGHCNPEVAEALVNAMVKNDGGDPSTISYMDVGFDLMSAMTTGNVDATYGCMLNHEVPQMEKEGFDVNYFMSSDFGVPKAYELVFLAGEKQLAENPEKIKKFLRASKKGFADMQKDPDATVKVLLEKQNAENFPLNEEVEQKSMEILLPVMETENAKFLSQTEEDWQKYIDWMFETGLITKKMDAKDIVADLGE